MLYFPYSCHGDTQIFKYIYSLRLTFMISLGFTFLSEWNMQFKEQMKRWLIFGKDVLRRTWCAFRPDWNCINTFSLCVVNSLDSNITSFYMLQKTLIWLKSLSFFSYVVLYMLNVFFNVELCLKYVKWIYMLICFVCVFIAHSIAQVSWTRGLNPLFKRFNLFK